MKYFEFFRLNKVYIVKKYSTTEPFNGYKSIKYKFQSLKTNIHKFEFIMYISIYALSNSGYVNKTQRNHNQLIPPVLCVQWFQFKSL